MGNQMEASIRWGCCGILALSRLKTVKDQVKRDLGAKRGFRLWSCRCFVVGLTVVAFATQVTHERLKEGLAPYDGLLPSLQMLQPNPDEVEGFGM